MVHIVGSISGPHHFALQKYGFQRIFEPSFQRGVQAESLQEFPRGPDGNPIVPRPAPPAVDLANVGAPTPKDPPTSLMPTPVAVQAARPPSPWRQLRHIQMSKWPDKQLLMRRSRCSKVLTQQKELQWPLFENPMGRSRRSSMSDHLLTSIGIFHSMISLTLSSLVVQIQRSQEMNFELSAIEFQR